MRLSINVIERCQNWGASAPDELLAPQKEFTHMYFSSPWWDDGFYPYDKSKLRVSIIKLNDAKIGEHLHLVSSWLPKMKLTPISPGFTKVLVTKVKRSIKHNFTVHLFGLEVVSIEYQRPLALSSTPSLHSCLSMCHHGVCVDHSQPNCVSYPP